MCKFCAFHLKYYALKVYNLKVDKNDFGGFKNTAIFSLRFPAGAELRKAIGK
jgi:hypothetical protein